MTEPTNSHELEAWLKDRPPEFAVAIAARIAMRSLPYLVEALYNRPSQRRAEFLLRSLCALAGAGFAAWWPHRANDARKVLRRIARDLSDAFAEQDDGIRLSLIEYQEIYEPPPSNLVRDARAFPLSERAILASVYAAQAAADLGDVVKGLASRSAPADAAMSCFCVACRNRSHGDGATYLEIGDDIDEEDDAEFDTESLDAVLTDARHLEDALTESQPAQQGARHLSATPLWPVGPPIWAGRKWADLVDELPDDEQWWVWTNWYEAHLAATPLNETVEYARATVGQSIAEGVVAVNTTLAQTIQANTDPLAVAVEHGFRGADALSDLFDFNGHWRRIQRALPEDPAGVVGATKDMLEAVMKTILQRRGKPLPTNIKFPALVDLCLAELGLQPRSEPTSPADRHARKFASTAGAMIMALNQLRNDAGTGHGRPESSDHESQAFGLSAPDAHLAAATSLILSAWLLHHDTDS